MVSNMYFSHFIFATTSSIYSGKIEVRVGVCEGEGEIILRSRNYKKFFFNIFIGNDR